MLYPRESETREVKDLSGIWNFRVDADREGRREKWYARKLAAGRPMPVPASYNDITQDRHIRDHIGEVWYERELFVPASWRGRRVMLRVGAASHKAAMFVNGRLVAEHKGGFLPFEADVSDAVSYGGANRVTIAVDNVLDAATLPPGKVQEIDRKPKGKYRIQDYQHDFYNYAGIHRPVRLYCTPKAHIADIAVVTDIRGAGGIVDYEVVVRGGRRDVRVRLLSESGRTVAQAQGRKGRLTVKRARLWQPGKAYLYTLLAEAVNKAGRAEDVYRLPVGIRTVQVRGRQFLINAKPFYFRGFGKHEDMDVKGKGLDDAINVKDVNLLKWVGANSFRTSHYPYSEEIMNLADREGIVVIDEAPAVGMYIFKGKQDVFNREALKPLLEHHVQCMNELVQRDKNHPCVVMWSVANEAATQEKAFGPYFRKVFAATRKADPAGRPVTIVLHTWFDNDLAAPYADVICLNRYWGWYGKPGHLDLIEGSAEWELKQWYRHQRKPMILSEFGADTIAGLHQDPPVIFTEEYQCEMVKRICRVLDGLDFIVGEHLWNFADFMTKQGINRVIGNRKGAFTRQRQPKAVAHLLRKRWTGKDLFGQAET
jgi:beta-glucuronidase